MTVVLNIPATLTCDKCGKKVETYIPVSRTDARSETYVQISCMKEVLAGVILDECPAVKEGWDIYLLGRWPAFCPDCRWKEESE